MQRYVENLYLRTWGYLQQGKTQADVNGLVAALSNAGQNSPDYAAMLQTAKDQANALFNSTQYLNSNTTNEQYIADLYLAYLQRPPESAEMIAYWAGPLYSGMSRAQRRLDFANSPEFAAIVNSLWGGESNDYGRVDRFIHNIYQSATGGLPGTNRYNAEHARFDAAEAANLSAVQEAGKALGRYLLGADPLDNSAHDAIGNALPAYRTDLLTAEYVRRLYETFLRRAPDSSYGYWQMQADNPNLGRGYVLEQFMGMAAYSEQTGALYREIYWLVSDHLGTARMILERTGSLAGIKRNDYLPFGESANSLNVQSVSNPGGRGWSNGYVVESVRQGFTGYERDDETGLDYAQARYCASQQGRFTSVDPLLLSGVMTNPKTWNRYVYALNNPLRLIDPSGLTPNDPNDPIQATGEVDAEGKPIYVETDPEIIRVESVANPSIRFVRNFGAGAMDVINPFNRMGRRIAETIAPRVIPPVQEDSGAYLAGVVTGTVATAVASGGVAAEAGGGSGLTTLGLSSNTATVTAEAAATGQAAQTMAAGGKPSVATSAAVDTTTGKVYTGTSGNPQPANLSPVMEQRVNAMGASREPWCITNCAEFKAANNALLDGASIENLEIHTVRTKTGVPFPRCNNCKVTTAGARVTSDPQ